MRGGIYALRSDGSNARWIYETVTRTVGPYAMGFWPTWSPDGNQIAFIDGSALKVVSASGGAPRLILPDTIGVSELYGLQYSADGQWIYFTRGMYGSQLTCWRVRPDATGLTQVSEQRDWGVEAMPSPNPSGEWIAYQSNVSVPGNASFTIRIIAPTMSRRSEVDVPGYSPRWSPRGDRIAYLNDGGQLQLLTAAGVVAGTVGSGIAAQPGFSWSYDGEWIVSVGDTGLRLVQLATGLVLPLPFTGPDYQLLLHPSLRPTP
jgi:Tol biopolymer transport system component